MSVDQDIAKAAKLAQTGKKAEAEKIYREILQRFPANQRALSGLRALGPAMDQGEQQALQALIVLFNQGQLRDLLAQAPSMLQRYPDSAPLHNLVGMAYARLGRAQDALASWDTALRLRPDDADASRNRSFMLRELKQFEAALATCDAALRFRPENPETWNDRGLVLREMKRFDEALASFDKTLRLKPGNAEAHLNRGNALCDLGRFDDALTSYDKAVQLKPDYAAAFNNRGNVLRGLRQLDAALAAYDKALQLRHDNADAYVNRGNVLSDLRRLDEALTSYDAALKLRPNNAEAHNNRGNVLRELKRFDEALASYDAALGLRFEYAEARNNRGVVLRDLNRLREALLSCESALRVRPDYAAAFSNRGLILRDLKQFSEALASCDAALKLAPANAEAWNNRGLVLRELHRFDEALASYERALEIKPDYAIALCHLLEQRARMCVWREDVRSAGLAGLGIEGDPVSPFAPLTLDDSLPRQLGRARAWAKSQFTAPARTFEPAAPSRKLRIGYFSNDFHEHAVMYLIARMLELHDKSRFEVHAFSYDTDSADPMRARLLGAVDQFHDVRTLSDAAVAELAREKGIDIAVDLKGYTEAARAGILAHRAAPVQISFLYAGTMGADFIDYFVADKVVLPESSQRFYTEKLIYLPNTYLVNDDRRAISERQFARAELGLPESGFVFCSFNNNYKITPAEFDVWMRLLRTVEGSVLWLLADNAWVAPNLRREAQARGVDPDRLVFAERMPLADHLARHRCADLFLDCFGCNAHTTASDALWTGLPVVTKLGESLAARVAGSLLQAIHAPELVTETVEDYEALALALATDPARLAAVRAKLAANRLTTPLFDSAQFTRDMERGYELAFQRHVDGLAPAHIDVGRSEAPPN